MTAKKLLKELSQCQSPPLRLGLERYAELCDEDLSIRPGKGALIVDLFRVFNSTEIRQMEAIILEAKRPRESETDPDPGTKGNTPVLKLLGLGIEAHGRTDDGRPRPIEGLP